MVKSFAAKTGKNMSNFDSVAVREYLINLQDMIVARLEQVDGKPFRRDNWNRPDGGGGISCILEGGNVLERGGVAFSHVTGDRMPPSATAHRPELAGRRWEAMGVSLVLHPRNPYAPAAHANVRMFVATGGHGKHAAFGNDARLPHSNPLPEREGANDLLRELQCNDGEAPIFWFGGSMDLTPYYGFEEDAVHFHRICKNSLAPFGGDLYPRFKKWCDEYFYLKHRNEQRGIGGIFFDDLSEPDFDTAFAIQQSVGDHFLPAYVPILERRKDTPYGERERDFQLYRRGRYVEFNLAIDRGTIFGLQTGGRTESILMSMPPLVKWRYDWHPEPGTPESELYEKFLVPQGWV